MAQSLAFQTVVAPASAEAQEDAVLRQQMADFDRAKFAGEVAGHVMRPADEAHVRELIRQGLDGDELAAAIIDYIKANPL